VEGWRKDACQAGGWADRMLDRRSRRSNRTRGAGGGLVGGGRQSRVKRVTAALTVFINYSLNKFCYKAL